MVGSPPRTVPHRLLDARSGPGATDRDPIPSITSGHALGASVEAEPPPGLEVERRQHEHEATRIRNAAPSEPDGDRYLPGGRRGGPHPAYHRFLGRRDKDTGLVDMQPTEPLLLVPSTTLDSELSVVIPCLNEATTLAA